MNRISKPKDSENEKKNFDISSDIIFKNKTNIKKKERFGTILY